MIRRLLVIIFLCFFTGCAGDSDVKVVNFDKTVEVAKPDVGASPDKTLQVAVAAMISPKETFVYYRELLEYVGARLGRHVKLVQRKTYGEIDELLGNGLIDLAFLCSGPYAAGKDRYGFELLATPEIHGSHFYHAYLIVNAKIDYDRLEDLRGKVFAFTDPGSNTGRLVPLYWLAAMGEKPETFFKSTIYTYSHDNSIMAVAKGLVDGASVDGFIWDYYDQRNPSLTSKTRVIRKSEPYGIPPLVASRTLSTNLKERISNLLFSMHQDADGRRILRELLIDRFVPPRDDWYDSIRQMLSKADLVEGTDHGSKKP
jgi:phosphonate transport system substrate-binding protein